MTTTLLAETWNSNAAGLLWSAEWRRDEYDIHWRYLYSSGVFTMPERYDDAAAMWKAFEIERAKFFGRVK